MKFDFLGIMPMKMKFFFCLFLVTSNPKGFNAMDATAQRDKIISTVVLGVVVVIVVVRK